jgi:carboxyl-terminal processing protease
MTSRTRLLVLLVSAPIVAFAVVGGFLGSAAARESPYQHLRVFEDVVSLVLSNYVEPVEVDRMMQGAMRGLSDGLDPDSAYLQPEEVRRLESGSTAGEAGIGVELTRQYYLRVIAARDGSPAADAGLRSGDYLRAIDGRSTRDLSVFQGMRLLQGPPGSKVTLTVIRGSAAEPHQVELVRKKPGSPTVSARMIADDVGYLRIAAFDSETATQIRREVDSLKRQGASKLAIDVRSTAEGPLQAGIETARLFVPSGTLTIRESRREGRLPLTTQQGDGTIILPATVLVSSGTTGAAEIFAAALAGNDRAEIIGERTLGRAADQKLVKLPDGGGLWISAARYLTPAGEPIHLKGLTPSIEVETPDVEFGAEAPQNDPVLDRVLERFAVRQAA